MKTVVDVTPVADSFLGVVVLSSEEGKYYVNYLDEMNKYAEKIVGKQISTTIDVVIDGPSPVEGETRVGKTKRVEYFSETLIGTHKEITPHEYMQMVLTMTEEFPVLPEEIPELSPRMVSCNVGEFETPMLKITIVVGNNTSFKYRYLAKNHYIHAIFNGVSIYSQTTKVPMLADHESLVNFDIEVNLVRESDAYNKDIISKSKVKPMEIIFAVLGGHQVMNKEHFITSVRRNVLEKKFDFGDIVPHRTEQEFIIDASTPVTETAHLNIKFHVNLYTH